MRLILFINMCLFTEAFAQTITFTLKFPREPQEKELTCHDQNAEEDKKIGFIDGYRDGYDKGKKRGIIEGYGEFVATPTPTPTPIDPNKLIKMVSTYVVL
ncbi:MAG: hypothetical protein QE271_05810 [Bacteriovoracaceae bacterium]|nr:hypothetical protein [Bacteriovoracaceae bacterium]